MTEPLMYSAFVNCAPASRVAVKERNEFFIVAQQSRNSRLEERMPDPRSQRPCWLFNLPAVLH